MEFWGAEVKSGQSLVVDPGEKLLHLSQACLDDLKKAKGSDPISLFAKVGDLKLVLGFLSAEKSPQLMFDIVFDEKFELSHNWKNGSVHFTGYKSLCIVESDSEEEDAPPIRAPTLVDKGKGKVNGTEVAKKPIKSEQKEASSDDDDDESDDSWGCEKLKRLADSWGCEVGGWPIKYLGLPLGGRPRALSFWDPVVEIMEKRLQNWKKAFLSRGGRLTLIQSVLGSLPIYYMSLFKIPSGVIGRLEKLMKGFLWEGVEEGKKNHLVKWEIVIKSKEEGGLGVGNLRNQNEALLAKWLWRFPKEPNSLWHKVIRSKYGMQDNGWNANPPLRGSSRSPWKDISCGLQSFLQCCKFEVGNGERVRCWEDSWLEGGPLKEQFPRLFLLSRMHNQNIASFVDLSINSLSWNFDFRRNLNEVEIEEAARLLQKVENARLSQSRADDRRWKLELSGLFTCKSYRSFLSNNGIVQHFPPSSQIWKSKVPPKVKVLVWLVAIGRLNTCDQIQRRSPFICISPHWCSLCKAKEESVNHIFLHCSYTIQLWWKLFQEVRVSWVIPKGCFELLSTNFEALGIGRKAKALWGCLVSAVFWNVWLERNKRIFEDYTGVGVADLWGRIKYWAAFWASVSNEFKNYSLSHILWDMLAVVK